MNSRVFIKYFILILASIAMLAGCGTAGKEDAEFPWSINVPELSVRLIIRNKSVELGQYPLCTMEVMNTSKQPILLRKDFSLNGPAVYDKDGNVMPYRTAVEVKTEDTQYYHLEPRQIITVRTAPNYKMDSIGIYTLKFGIHSTWWGFEDPQSPGKIVIKDAEKESSAVSNEVQVRIY